MRRAKKAITVKSGTIEVGEFLATLRGQVEKGAINGQTSRPLVSIARAQLYGLNTRIRIAAVNKEPVE